MSVSSASKGTLFFSFHRKIGTASSAERGNSSKCCTKTRITVSGRIMATSSSRERKRPQTSATAVLTAAPFTMLASTAEGTSAPGGSNSTAYPSSVPVRLQRAAATRSGPTSTAKETGGMASNQRAIRRTQSNSYIPCRNAAVLLNESHLVNFFHRCDARTNLG